MSVHIAALCRRCIEDKPCADRAREDAWEERHDRLSAEEDARLADPPQRPSRGYGVASFEGFDQWGNRLYSAADPIEEERRG